MLFFGYFAVCFVGKDICLRIANSVRLKYNNPRAWKHAYSHESGM